MFYQSLNEVDEKLWYCLSSPVLGLNVVLFGHVILFNEFPVTIFIFIKFENQLNYQLTKKT